MSGGDRRVDERKDVRVGCLLFETPQWPGPRIVLRDDSFYSRVKYVLQGLTPENTPASYGPGVSNQIYQWDLIIIYVSLY